MYKKIVSLLPSCTEIICKLGYSENLVGISHECDYPNSISGLPVLTKARLSSEGNSIEINKSVSELLQKGLSVYDVDASLLKSLSPDIIVTQAQCEACAVSLDQVKGIVSNWTRNKTEIISLEPNNLNEVWHGFDIIANAMNAPESSSILKTEINERFKLIKDKLDGTEKKKLTTLLDQSPLEKVFPACKKLEIGIIIGSPYASGILAAGSNYESTYDYVPANNEILKKVSSIEAICRKYDVPLKAASLQFPLFHPLVTSVIPGVLDKVQVLENIQMIKHPIPLELWLDLKKNGLIHPEAPVTLSV